MTGGETSPYLERLTATADGRYLAFTARAGLSADEYGSRAFVVDLESMKADLVLPVRFNCLVERHLERLRWVEAPADDGGFILSPQLTERLQPAVGSPVPTGDRLDSFVREFRCAAQLLVKGVDDFGVDMTLVAMEIRRFVAGALELDPTMREAAENLKLWGWQRASLGDVWFDFAADMQQLAEGHRMDADKGGPRARARSAQPAPAKPEPAQGRPPRKGWRRR